MQRDILDALTESTIQTIFMDFGFIPHYETVVFDTKGEGAVSQLRESWEDRSLTVVVPKGTSSLPRRACPREGVGRESSNQSCDHRATLDSRLRGKDTLLRQHALQAIDVANHVMMSQDLMLFNRCAFQRRMVARGRA
ncbi:MAG: hypothetical protein ACR2GY_13585 [Phycisphaerales bacterium]